MNAKGLLKKMLPKKISQQIITLRAKQKLSKLSKKLDTVREKNKIIFLLATPNHGNIGDQAIAVAERQFLAEELGDYYVVEVMFNEYLIWKDHLQSVINEGDVICYHGGGNMGTQYIECENVFRDIIQRFPNNRIITFPQTIFYDPSDYSQRELENSKKIYAMNPQLTLVAREKYSYDIMKKEYGNINQVLLVPDIVLYLRSREKSVKKGALTCLRKDVEQNLREEDRTYILNVLHNRYRQVVESDTVIEKDYVSREDRKNIVDEKLNEFSKAEVVVTDRLHGMVFAYLTNTPCIVLKNYNHKVQGVYDWIKSQSDIVLLDDIKRLPDILEKLQAEDKNRDAVDRNLYNPLKEAIKGGKLE